MAAVLTDWRADAIVARVKRASRAAIDEVTEEAARDAGASHWWRSRSGQLEGEIISEPAETHGDQVVGRFGSTRGPGFYGLILEHRTPFLRPAADRTFPKLAARIRARL